MPAIRSKPVSQLSPSPIRWLWEPYLARGALAVLDGDPEIGKSLITIDLAARLSRGIALPGGAVSGRPHVTILLGTEDNAADTITPRVLAAAADPERVIVPEEEDVANLSFPANIPELEELIRAHVADLVVLDPIVAFLPSNLSSATDHGVRMSLKPLADLARRTDCAILLVRHLRKKEGGRALYRGLGSIGFVAAARTGPVRLSPSVRPVALRACDDEVERRGSRADAGLPDRV
jgi:RecA-family ATPase